MLAPWTNSTEPFNANCADCKVVASIAHEIANPLDALLNLLYLLEAEATLTEKGHHYLRLATEEVTRASQIAHTALSDFRAAQHPKAACVSALLRTVIDFYQPQFDSQGISVRTRYRSEASLPVYAGPLRQAFSNLLLNAAHAMPRGGQLNVRVCATRARQERNGLRITIADNGCGIPAELRPKIFEPSVTTKGAAGNGLGLSLVRDVLKKHGGAVRVRSSTRPGHSGSIFTMFLPAVQAIDSCATIKTSDLP